jgi:REP element-mobilizing transposase RayT
MPRHPRFHAEGLLYHVMARGNNGQKIFVKQSDYEAFLEALLVVRKRYPFYLYAYVAQDRFIRGTVFEEGYLASEVATFLACHPSNVSRALQKNNLS